MLKRLSVHGLLALVALLGIVVESQAKGGLFRRSSGCGGCEAPCAAAPVMPVAQVAPQFEDRKVTAYKYVTVEKEIDVVVCRTVMKDVPYTFTVCVPVTKQETRKQTYYQTVQKEVEYKYTVLVPRTVQRTVKQTTYRCETEQIVEKVPVCRTIRVSCVDECGRCYTRCERVTVMEDRTRCVVKRIPVVQDVVINEVVCDRVEKVGKRIVCDVVPQVRDVVVNVCTMTYEKREGVRKVCEVVRENAKQKVQVCQQVAYETTVRVQIGGGECAPTCDVGYGGGHGGRRGGLSRRGGCCH